MSKLQHGAIRILLVDDEESILELYQKVLQEHQRTRSPGRLGQLAAQLFGRRVEDEPEELHFSLAFARQAEDAVALVEEAMRDDQPFSVVFMDIRMPPGPDGVWAAEQIRKRDPSVEIILVTGFSDLDPKEIARRVPPLDKLLYIEKPFFPQEIRHFACSLGVKRQTERELMQVRGDLENLVRRRTAELEETNRRLIAEISEHERTEMLREFRGAIMEKLVSGSSLREVVDAMVTGIGFIRPDISLALMMPDQTETSLQVLPASDLPDYMQEALQNVPIAADEPCCGRAAFLREPVMMTADDAVSPAAKALCRLAHRAGISGCWARPVLSDKHVPAVLVVFFREARQASSFENRLVDAALQMVSLAVERHRDEEDLKKLLAAVEQNPTGIMITGINGVVSYVNRRFSEMTGYTAEEVVGKPINQGPAGIVDTPEITVPWEAIRAGQTWDADLETVARDGRSFLEHVVISGITGPADQAAHLLIMRQDISERREAEDARKQLESRLLQAQKMETIGTLAGGIAHDFNNMLTPILGYTEMAISDMPADGEVRGFLEHVLRASGRAKELVQQMLTFSRRGVAEKEPIRINLVVNEALKLLRAGLPTTIRIEQDVDNECGHVKANPTQLIQVMMNLCANAKHAMRERGGVITVKLARMEAEDVAMLGHNTLTYGNHAVLTIGDTGMGISAGNLERVFEPFFTTKDAGEGTGLGLSVVHGIIASHGGDIFVESRENEGSTFTMYLPLTDEEAAPAVVPEAPHRGRSEHILFVDDEEMIVQMYSGMLENMGYRVSGFTDPRRALERFLAEPESYHLLMTDQTMPHLTGVDLARKTMAARPDFPVILTTGFSEDVNEDNCQELGIRGFLMKPMNTSEVAGAIRKILDT